MKRPEYRKLLTMGMLVLGVPLVLSLLGFASERTAEPFLATPSAGTACVRDVTTMRYHHMTYLKDLRDQVVREGARHSDPSIQSRGIGSCRGCHTDRSQFCDKCHSRAGVSLDCFGCHAY